MSWKRELDLLVADLHVVEVAAGLMTTAAELAELERLHGCAALTATRRVGDCTLRIC